METEDYRPTRKMAVEPPDTEQSAETNTDVQEPRTASQADEIAQETLPVAIGGSPESVWLPGNADKIVEHINGLFGRHIARGMEEIGRFILTTVFRGDTKEASSKNPRKNESYKRIADHPDNKLGSRRLGEAVRVAAFTLEMERTGVVFKNLAFTHKLALVRVQNEDDRRILALEADEDKSSVARIERLVKDVLGQSDIGRAVVKAIGSPKECQRHYAMLTDSDALAKLPKADRIKLRHKSETKRQILRDHCEFLRQVETLLFDIETQERRMIGFHTEENVSGPAPDTQAPAPEVALDKTAE